MQRSSPHSQFCSIYLVNISLGVMLAGESMALDLSITRLKAAVIDGRSRNIRYRQNELQSLHLTLSQNPEVLCAAITKDNQAGSIEVEAEFFCAIDALRTAYESIDFDTELQDEYLVANGKDDKNRHVAVGLVVIRPTSHTRLYSIIAPISAAIAAGNCILLELEPTTLVIDSVLRDLLSKALDREAFIISTKRIDESELPYHVLVDQRTTTEPRPSKVNEILSSTSSRTIAIVDRTADVETAAQAIVTSRFSFQSTSPYALDLVIVNEFIKSQFLDACTRFASQFFVSEKGRKLIPSNAAEETKKAIKKAEGQDEVSTFGSPDFTLLDIQDRSSPLTRMKITGKYLPITFSSSLTDAVFFPEADYVYLAGYFFGDNAAAKFMGQYLNCHATFVNQIPPQLLFGPAASLSHPAVFPHRYNRTMFSVTRPQFTTPACHSSSPLSQIMSPRGKSIDDKVALKNMRALAIKPMRPIGQGKGEAVDFFIQGLLTGGAVWLTLIPAVTYGGWKLVCSGWNVWAGKR